MLDLSEPLLLALQDEFHKEAMSAGLISRLKNVGSLGGTGALIGAGGGAMLGGVRGYNQAQENGQSGIGGALAGAGSGALAGGALGGLVGGGAGALAKRDFGHLAVGEGPLASAARFGQRQVHGLTGMLKPEELEGIRGGAYTAKRNLDEAMKAHAAAELGNAPGPGIVRRTGEGLGVLRPQTAADQTASALKTRVRAEKAHGVAARAQNMGLSHVPGYLKSLATSPVKTLSTSAEEQFRTQPLLTAGMVGVPLAAGMLAKPHEGEGKGETVGRAVGNATGMLAGGVMPVGGQIVMGEGMKRVGSWAGRAADRGVGRLRGPGQHHAPTPTLEPTEAQHIPTERVLSPAAAGQAPEGIA